MTTTRKTEPKVKVVKKTEAKKDNGKHDAKVPEPKIEAKKEETPAPVVSKPASLVRIAEKAWNKVKGSGDASFAECQPAFIWVLMAHAESVEKTHTALEGDTSHARFEQEVLRLIGE